MPRIAAVSGRTTTWFSRVNPSPFTTFLCFTGVQIADRTHFNWIFPLATDVDVLVFISLPRSWSSVISERLATNDQRLTLLQLLYRLASQRRNVFPALELLQRVERRLDHVMRIGRANRLRQHILNPRRRHHRTYRSAR